MAKGSTTVIGGDQPRVTSKQLASRATNGMSQMNRMPSIKRIGSRNGGRRDVRS